MDTGSISELLIGGVLDAGINATYRNKWPQNLSGLTQ